MRRTVLIVDDHGAMRWALLNWLKIAFPHCRIVEAASAEEALTVIQTVDPDLVIMDFKLPGMNGVEATRQIKATLPSVSVVMLSANDDITYRSKAAEAGAKAYISKWRMGTELEPVVAQLLYQ